VTPLHFPFTSDWLYWRYPWVLAAALLLIPLWWLWTRPQRRSALRYSDLSNVAAAGGTSGLGLRVLLPALRTIALASLIVACARPQRADATSQTFAEGIAIYMVMDTSSSMRDMDLDPVQRRNSRLDVVKEVFRQFVMGDERLDLPGRPNDLIGIIRFARYADSLCPLTLDRNSLLQALAQVQLVATQEEDGTAMGDGLGLAVERLKNLKRTSGSGAQLTIRSRVVILLTDGENNLGMLTPVKAGELAASYGIKVYTILAGTGQAVGPFRRPVDDTDLRKIAELTGGKFFHAGDPASLRQIYAEIDQLERSQTEERRFEHYDELCEPWLLAAFAALLLQVALDATWLRKTP
jgi:Ca-activated chloride channel family protein